MVEKTIHLLQKFYGGGSLALRWSDEPNIIGFGLNFDMAKADLAERREKQGLLYRAVTVHEVLKEITHLHVETVTN